MRIVTSRMATSSLAVILTTVLASQGRAQAPQAPTTVQLPTFRFFNVTTSVSVPDRGGASLGGVSRARSSSSSRGAPGLRGSCALASDREAGGMSVHATIIDHEELDRAVLAAAAGRSGARSPSVEAARADYVTRHVGSTNDRPQSLAEIRRQNAQQNATPEIAALFAKAETLVAAGKPSVAKIYYQMVVRRDEGELRTQAAARLRALEVSPAAPQRGE